MHETEKHKANLIYNLNFLEKFDFIVQVKWIKLKTILGALNNKLQEKTKGCKTKKLHYCPEMIIQVLRTLQYQERHDSRLSDVGDVTPQIPLVDRK